MGNCKFVAMPMNANEKLC